MNWKCLAVCLCWMQSLEWYVTITCAYDIVTHVHIIIPGSHLCKYDIPDSHSCTYDRIPHVHIYDTVTYITHVQFLWNFTELLNLRGN